VALRSVTMTGDVLPPCNAWDNKACGHLVTSRQFLVVICYGLMDCLL
jgi:hypothetical protein